MSARDQAQSEEERSLRQDVGALRKELAELPPVLAGQVEAHLQPLEEVKTSSTALSASNQALTEALKKAEEKMRALIWHLENRTPKEWLGLRPKEWGWVALGFLLGAAGAQVWAVALVKWLT